MWYPVGSFYARLATHKKTKLINWKINGTKTGCKASS
jgi:hypothetical protein